MYLEYKYKSINTTQFFFLKAQQQQTRPDKPLAPPSQAQLQWAGMSFTCSPVGLNPEPFLRSQTGAISISQHPFGTRLLLSTRVADAETLARC